MSRIRQCGNLAREANAISTYLNNCLSLCLLLDFWRWNIRDFFGQRVRFWISSVFSRFLAKYDNVLIAQYSTVCENQAIFTLSISQLLCHLGESVKGVVVSCTAKGRQAAEQGNRFTWVSDGKAEVRTGELRYDGEARVEVVN